MAVENINFNNDTINLAILGGNLTGGQTTITGTLTVDYTAMTVTGTLTDAANRSYTDFAFSTSAGGNTVLTSTTGNQTYGLSIAYPATTIAPTTVSTNSSALGGVTNAQTTNVQVTSTPVCFCSGTLIRTVRGDVAVEDLRVGDVAVTSSGAHRPIVWIGWKKIACANAADPEKAWPVRVHAGAFAHNMPARDLYLSPGHAVVPPGEAVLIPIGHLVNGTNVTRDPRDSVTYWHVELDRHDLLLAEGLAAESFIDVDVGDRAWFENGHAVEERRLSTYADMCVPYFVEWDRVDATKHLLGQRAADAEARKLEHLLCGAF